MQLVILSGKGGTGKTTIAAAISYLTENTIKADCDVDAANLHIILKGQDLERKPFVGAKMARIDPDLCIQCGKCQKVCRFQAIEEGEDGTPVINELKCEGCAACTVVCSTKAIILRDEETGQTIITETEKGILSRAEMEIGAEGSGKLVTEVRKNAAACRKNNESIIIDGSPGIGCAVMASTTGCDAALAVVEPTLSGLEDFARVSALCQFFKIKALACINKFDLNREMTAEIERFCRDNGIEVAGKIPFDSLVVKSVNELKPIVSYENSPAGREIKKMWNQLLVTAGQLVPVNGKMLEISSTKEEEK